ncbi:hypothetical protein NLM27_26980 [Bradyrhizobium sp. CCGB12]|uniref:hypothetical protein n=1 Tax=Bradyrhizobium sp. CCGB12 TaxID=2949632 RepID=UPI0020B3BBEF|nr:hypothetical protein [Bradyrhizobium sp. CCGB12]MCP3392394.1 hypothetical protein [Bradyrhizobium sp. CCGB12]
MAVKAKKGRKAKTSKAAKKVRKAKTRKVAKKALGGKPARPGGTHVDFGLHGLGRIMRAVHDAGLVGELDQHLGKSGQFAKVSRKTLTEIKTFVASKEKLSGLAEEIDKCDCPAWDPGCVYIPG